MLRGGGGGIEQNKDLLLDAVHPLALEGAKQSWLQYGKLDWRNHKPVTKPHCLNGGRTDHTFSSNTWMRAQGREAIFQKGNVGIKAEYFCSPKSKTS